MSVLLTVPKVKAVPNIKVVPAAPNVKAVLFSTNGKENSRQLKGKVLS